MRHFLFVLTGLVILLSFNLIGSFAQEDIATVLQVVDSEPVNEGEVSLSDPLTIYFDRFLDCLTAERATGITPAVNGEVSCTETSITFTPTTEFVRATDYIFTIDTSVRGQDGAQLLEDYELRFRSVGDLTISEVFPAADGGIETDSTVTVIFSRPVVPLVSVEDMGDLPNPLTITPATEGAGEWLNTAIYTFTPDEHFLGGTEYTVQVDAGLTAIDGSVLQETFEWSFTTSFPQITSFSPEPLSGDVALDTMVQVTFNQPMDRQSVEDGFSLQADSDESQPVVGEFEWNNEDTGFGFTPDENLELDELYTAKIENGLARGSDADLVGSTRWSFATVPFPAIVGTDPLDGEQGAPPFGGVDIFFASPMDIDSFEDKITIEPEPNGEIELFYRDWNNSLSVAFPLEPSEEYTVTVASGMADVYGNTIDDEFAFSFSTRAYDSSVNLQVPGSVGFYNAYRDPIQLFLTHRNVSHVDLSLYAVDTDIFVEQLANENYNPARFFNPSREDRIKRWRIESEAPENVLRYDLLDLTPGAAECGSLPSRLAVGDIAISISDPDPVRARAEPVDGEVLELLYRSYSLTVTDGPICEDNLLWWEVELRDERRAWVAEFVDDEYLLDVRIPSTATTTTVTDSDGELLTPGIYFLQAQSPETEARGHDPLEHFLLVSTVNMTMKSAIDGVTIWVTDVDSSQPIEGVMVSVYDQDGVFIDSGSTNEDGVVEIATPRLNDLYETRMAVLNDGGQFGMTFSEWSSGVEPWSFGQNYDFFPKQYRLYAYTDRPIYRPGQPVYFRGIVRQKDDVTYTPVEFDSVPVTITDDRGDIVFDEMVELTPFGSFSGQFDIAEDAPLGFYRMDVELESDAEFRSEGGGVSFTVAEFRLPEFQVEVSPVEPEVVQGDTVQVQVDSSFFFGGPVSNARVEYFVTQGEFFFDYDGPGGRYDFTDFNFDEGPGAFFGSSSGLIASGEETTDDRGMLVIEIPAEFEDETQSQRFTIEAVVLDESDQAVAGRTDVIVHQGLVYIGARPESYVSFAGQEAMIEIVSVDWASEVVGGQEIDVEVVERRWSSVQEQDEVGRTTWTWEVEEIPVTDGTVTTDGNGNGTFTFTPPNGGIFKVIITTRDEIGNEVRASTTMWVSGSQYVAWRQQNSNRIDLIADQDEYNVGDTAQILITSPFQGTAEAWITVERGEVLEFERVTMDSNSYIYELPIVADFAPNVYVSVFVVKGVDENNPVAAFRMGTVQLGVEIDQKEITIDVESDVEQAMPQQTVTYTIRTTDYNGDPVQAEVGVGVTDLASLSLMGPNSSPILTFFYGEQGLGIRTATPLTINTDELTQTTLDTIKGGGGGGIGEGIIDIRGEFVDTPFWDGAVVTDETGTATIDVRLPDNLTTWRLDARAVTSGEDGLTLVGQDTFDLLSTRPIIVRPQTPRFFVVDDELVVAAVVNNNTDEDLETVVTLQADGVEVASDLAQTITIPARGRSRVNWNVTVNEVENVVMIFTADAGEYTDGSISPVSIDDEGTLPVYRYEVPETVGTAGSLRSADTRVESIVLPRRFDVTQGELTLTVDQSLAGATIDGLEYLENFPHQCIEQTISRFLPNIMTFRALNELDLADAELEGNLNSVVNQSLQKLYAEQKADGGWGWFLQDRSNPLTTSYALIGLAEAREQGFEINERVFNDARSYLLNQMITPEVDQPQWRMNRQVFMLYALARTGVPDVGRTVAIYDFREQLSIYAKAFLAQTLFLINPDDTRRTDVLLSDILNEAIVSATGIHWQEEARDRYNWNTDTRTTAIVLDTLVRQRPDSELIPNIVRYLMVQRRADAWETTQETAWAVMALTDWMVTSGELQPDYSYEISLNDAELLSGVATPDTVMEQQKLMIEVSELLKDEANLLLLTRSAGNGALYYTAHLRVFLPVPEIEPLDRGIVLQRRYSLLEDENQTPITEATVGDIVQVRLTIFVPNDLHYVVIEDPLPAGAEGIDPNLEISQQVGTRPGLDNSDPISRGWGWWWFSNIEFRDEKVVLYSTFLPSGTYEYVYTIRPGLPGTYNVIPATGYEFYFPEVYGRSAGTTFTILPADE